MVKAFNFKGRDTGLTGIQRSVILKRWDALPSGKAADR